MSLEVQIRKKEADRTLKMSLRTEERFLSVLGEESDGKTALLHCLSGLVLPDEGSISLNGRVLYDSLQKICIPPAERRAVLLPENYALFPGMTVEENLRLVLRETERNVHRKERKLITTEKTAQLLKEYGLDGLGGCYPGELSRAQQLRAAMARTMAASPELVLLDNPFSRLDPYLRAELLAEIREKLSGEKKVTVVLATADRDEAYAMGGDIVSLENGVTGEAKPRDFFFREPSTVGAALLSGCHNIAEARRLDAYHALVPAWGAVFVFSGKKAATGQKGWEKLPEDLAAIGIREEDFRRELPKDAAFGEYRCFTIHVEKIEEELQNWKVWFTAGRLSKRRSFAGKASGGSALENGQGTDERSGLFLWKISRREISREELRGIRRLYVKNRQIMRLSDSKQG